MPAPKQRSYTLLEFVNKLKQPPVRVKHLQKSRIKARYIRGTSNDKVKVIVPLDLNDTWGVEEWSLDELPSSVQLHTTPFIVIAPPSRGILVRVGFDDYHYFEPRNPKDFTEGWYHLDAGSSSKVSPRLGVIRGARGSNGMPTNLHNYFINKVPHHV
jgi:hypothetical protein